MLIDTHCHINTMVKQTFDVALNTTQIEMAATIIESALNHDISIIINVGTSLVESSNCIALAQAYRNCYATVGIHPTDLSSSWKEDFNQICTLVKNKQANKIVGIGETGIDLYHPQPNLQRQQDAFKAHIELALEHDLAIVVHSREAAEQTMRVLELYQHDINRGVMHCFSYDRAIAQAALDLKLKLGIGGTLTYPKNSELRTIVQSVPLDSIMLETDAPFLPPQHMRGKQNHPSQIQTVAKYMADLRNEPYQAIAKITSQSAVAIFKLDALIAFNAQ